MKFVNFLNLELNCWLKPKKVIKSKTTMYLWSSNIKKIVDILQIISHGNSAYLRYLSSSLNFKFRKLKTKLNNKGAQP